MVLPKVLFRAAVLRVVVPESLMLVFLPFGSASPPLFTFPPFLSDSIAKGPLSALIELHLFCPPWTAHFLVRSLSAATDSRYGPSFSRFLSFPSLAEDTSLCGGVFDYESVLICTVFLASPAFTEDLLSEWVQFMGEAPLIFSLPVYL